MRPHPKWINRFFLFRILVGCLMIIAVSVSSTAIAQGGTSAVPDGSLVFGNGSNQNIAPTDQILIRYTDLYVSNGQFSPAGIGQMQRLDQAAGLQLSYLREMSDGSLVLRLPSKMDAVAVQAILDQLKALPEVEIAEPDLIMQVALEPNDTNYPNQWHYFAPVSGNYGINAPAGWDITTGAASVVVAVVDTGITNHSEFSGRIVPGYDFISDIQIANDGNARDSDPSDPGDWITPAENASGFFNGCPITNSSWHGTHTAGTIGANSNNSVGVAGINWNSKLLPVRVLGKCGGYLSDIIDGMRWAAGLTVTGVPANANPAKVINISLGGSGTCSTTMQTAINSIVTAGTTIVVSAGNSGANASGFTPANCNNVITVSATNRSGSLAYYSNYGSTVEISAPGGEQSFANDPNGILSTLNTGTTVPVADTYVYYQGTSMAAPHVTGVVSLLYSLNQQVSPSQILSYLQSTATAFPNGSSCTTSTCGSGIVNAGEAVKAIFPTSVDLLSFTAMEKSRAVLLNWETASEIDNVGFNLYRARSLDGSKVKLNEGLIQAAYPGSLSGSEYTYKNKTAKPGKVYYYWLEAVDLNGGTELFGPVKAKIKVQ